VGFETRNYLIVVKDKAIVRNFEIPSSSIELDQVEVRVRRRDPAYEIIQKVIRNRDKFLAQSQSYRTQVYVRAVFMWIKESNFRQEELYGGVERIFKLGARRRLKIGVYGVFAQSNVDPPKADWKISFDVIDTWKRDWSY
jgi:hypothetical protein